MKITERIKRIEDYLEIDKEKKEKEYEVSEKIIYLSIEWIAAIELRDKYIEKGSMNKALKASRKCENCRMEFWNAIFKRYPELDDKKVKYDWKKRKVIIIDD